MQAYAARCVRARVGRGMAASILAASTLAIASPARLTTNAYGAATGWKGIHTMSLIRTNECRQTTPFRRLPSLILHPPIQSHSLPSRSFASWSSRGGGRRPGPAAAGYAHARALVAAHQKNKAVSLSFLPLGQLPHVPSLPILPVHKPVMPGLKFDFDLRLYPAATRAALTAEIAAGRPYVALSLLQPTARTAALAIAESHWSKEERKMEGLDNPRDNADVYDEEEYMDPVELMSMRMGMGMGMELGVDEDEDEDGHGPDETITDVIASVQNKAKKDRHRPPIYPVLTDLSLVRSIGVAAQVCIVDGHTHHPRLKGVVHRRVQLMSVLEEEEATQTPKYATTESTTVANEQSNAQSQPQSSPSDTAPESTIVTVDVTNPDPSAAVEASLDEIVAQAAAQAQSEEAVPSAQADEAARETPVTSPSDMMLRPLSMLHARVKHLDDARTVATDTKAATASDTTTPAATSSSSSNSHHASSSPTTEIVFDENDDLIEKAYVKEINQTIMELSKEPHISHRVKLAALCVESSSSSGGAASPGRVADLAVHIASARAEELQRCLELINVRQRLEHALFLWKSEAEDVRIKKEVNQTVMAKHEILNQRLMLKERKKVLDEMVGADARKAAAEAAAAAAAASSTGTGANTGTDSENGSKATPNARPHIPRGTDKESIRLRFLARIGPGSGRVVPAAAQKVIDEECARFMSLEPDSGDYQVTRNYLDWLTSVPWGVHTEEKFDLDFAEQLLEKEHYGMEEVKQRILEFVATGMLLNQVPQGKILCLVGPPGVGKTSIGRSIAAALQRKFYRFSVGGLEDVSEIKGHRRTYVGAMPGKVIQALKRTEASNPVILIDELDKLGRSHRGDPSSALLEVLDPEQNAAFSDHYLDVPVDLSKVLFIATANERHRIPEPLQDRMDFITISGYVLQEKVAIAQNHLIPSVQEKTGVDASSLKITDDALIHLIRWYCREAGVRGLQKQLERIHRKAALKIARARAELEEQEASADQAQSSQAAATDTVREAEIITATTSTTTVETASASSSSTTDSSSPFTTPSSSSPSLELPLIITPDNLTDYVGKPTFTSDRMYIDNPIGVATGLGTNSLGGWLLYTECTTADQHATVPPQAMRIPSKPNGEQGRKESTNNTRPQPLGRGELFCTGQLGDVIRESTSIAYTVAKRYLAQHTHPTSIHRNFFAKHRIHLHLPEGATPKDGPSAGIAMVTSLLSLALNTPPAHALAMTGELTLTGKVLPIGGVKEKIMAAKHAGITTVLLPSDNRKDVDELKPYVTEGLTIHYVSWYDEVFQHTFPHFTDTLWPTEPPMGKALQPDETSMATKAPSRTKSKRSKTPTLPTIPGMELPQPGAPLSMSNRHALSR